jgi:hypothetical protein
MTFWFGNLSYDWERPNVQYKEGILTISGNSIPTEAYSTYIEIIDELEQYAKQNLDLTAVFKLNSCNSSSLRQLKRIIQILNDMLLSKTRVTVYWYYDEVDERMEEIGDDLKEFAKDDFKTRIIKQNNKLKVFEFKLKKNE